MKTQKNVRLLSERDNLRAIDDRCFKRRHLDLKRSERRNRFKKAEQSTLERLNMQMVA